MEIGKTPSPEASGTSPDSAHPAEAATVSSPTNTAEAIWQAIASRYISCWACECVAHHMCAHLAGNILHCITCVPIWQAIYYIASHVCPSGRQYITLHHMCAHLAGTDLERVPGRRSGSTSHTAHVSHMRITQCNITSRGPKRRPGCCSKLLPACGERCSICMRISPSMRVRL